jgi:hypothetical protein
VVLCCCGHISLLLLQEILTACVYRRLPVTANRLAFRANREFGRRVTSL